MSGAVSDEVRAAAHEAAYQAYVSTASVGSVRAITARIADSVLAVPRPDLHAGSDETVAFLVRTHDRLVTRMAEALGLDPDRDDDCVPGCTTGPAGSDHLLWHLTERAGGGS